MARIKTNRTERITLMLAPETIAYLTTLGADKCISSVSMVADQVINEHRSFFSKGDNSSEQIAQVSQQPAATGQDA